MIILVELRPFFLLSFSLGPSFGFELAAVVLRSARSSLDKQRVCFGYPRVVLSAFLIGLDFRVHGLTHFRVKAFFSLLGRRICLCLGRPLFMFWLRPVFIDQYTF